MSLCSAESVLLYRVPAPPRFALSTRNLRQAGERERDRSPPQRRRHTWPQSVRLSVVLSAGVWGPDRLAACCFRLGEKSSVL
ncbi:hypothetical protein RRG08_054871 [Elysia crispata]|uniref:Uncharacterized protein n=1 Tax=Elysia crispata TaxID=231223 RepID=A0AAE1DSX7_9GAST|nr:hypothetical protein RRG08_054871 [Elysia crispata]